MKTIYEIIRELREDRDLTQSEIANLIGISQQQYSRYENGESEIPLQALSVIADYYSVSTDYLLGRKDCFYGVPGLDKKVTAERTADEVLNEILSLGAAGRAAVVEYITLQAMKESRAQKKKQDGQTP